MQNRADLTQCGLREWFRRMPLVAIIIVSLAQSGAVLANDQTVTGETTETLLERIKSISTTHPPHEVRELIDAIHQHAGELTPTASHELGLIEARQWALENRHDLALNQIEWLLAQPLRQPHHLRALTLGSNIALNADEFELAFRWLQQAVDRLDVQGDPESAIDIHYQSAYLFNRINQHESAALHARKSVDMALERQLWRDACYSYHQLLYALTKLERLQVVEPTMKLADSACQQTDDPVIQASIQVLFGEIFIELSQIEKALSHIQLGLDQHRATGYLGGEVEALAWKGSALVELGERDAAERALRDALESFTATEELDAQALTLKTLSTLMADKGDFENALAYLRQAVEVRSRLDGKKQEMELGYLSAQFQSQLRDQELEVLRQQLQIAAFENRTQRQQVRLQVAGYLVAALLLLILALLVIHTRRERRHYQRLSEHDGLTGLLNHRAFFEQCQQRLVQRANNGVLVMADIDHFKLFNDRYGHSAGDDALRAVAAELRRSLPEHTLIGRIGGEEFIALLTDTSLEQARQIVNRFRQALKPVVVDGQPHAITLSFGLAATSSDISVEALRRRADDALYKAKDSGRDRVVLA